jgi:hypothetical protein
MKRYIRPGWAIAWVVIELIGLRSAAFGQERRAEASDAAVVDPQEAARREILESDRWRRTSRRLNEWLSVQKIYSPEEIAGMRAALTERIAGMSPEELNDLMDDMDARLEVLLSPEAADARSWLNQYLAVVRDPEERLRSMRPDLAQMTASQIRQELHAFQDQRTARRRAQEAFDRTRMQQVQSLSSAQAANAQAAQQARAQRAATFGSDSPSASQYAPVQRNPRRPLPPPGYGLGPWGGPLFWYPVRGARW